MFFRAIYSSITLGERFEGFSSVFVIGYWLLVIFFVALIFNNIPEDRNYPYQEKE